MFAPYPLLPVVTARRREVNPDIEPIGSAIRLARFVRSVLCGVTLSATQVALASGPAEINADAPPWRWCDSLQFNEELPQSSCADIERQWDRCRNPEDPCSRHEMSRLLTLATRLDDPARHVIAPGIIDTLEQVARDYLETEWLDEDRLYGFAGQTAALAHATASPGEFMSPRDRSMVAIARGSCSPESLDVVFAEHEEPASCFLLRSPVTARALSYPGFRSALVRDVVRDLASSSATRSTCAASLVHRHWHALDPEQHTTLLDWLESALPSTDPAPSGTASTAWTGTMEIAVYWPSVVSRPTITSKLIAMSFRQNQSPRTAAGVRIPADLGLLTQPLPLIVDDQQPTFDDIVVLGGPDPGEARKHMLADPRWTEFAIRFDDLDLIRWLAARESGLPAAAFADNSAVGNNPTLALRLSKLPGTRTGIAIDRERLTDLQRTTLASPDVDDPEVHAEIADAFRLALQHGSHWHRSAALWNLLIACGMVAPSMTDTPIDVHALPRLHANELTTCPWFQSLPTDMKSEIVPPVE